MSLSARKPDQLGGRIDPINRHRLRRVLAMLLVVVLVVLAVWGWRLWDLRGDVDRYATFWSMPRGEISGLLYVALGDSAAQGLGASRPERGYVGLIAEQLRLETGRPVEVINLSRSGARISDVVRDQVPQLAGLEPDLVTVDIGGNDIRRYDPAAYERDVVALCAALPAGTVIADTPYFMHGRWQRDAGQAAVVMTREAISRGLAVVSLHAALKRQGWSAMLSQYAADWFHPNDRGYGTWAAAFWETIAVNHGRRLGLDCRS